MVVLDVGFGAVVENVEVGALDVVGVVLEVVGEILEVFGVVEEVVLGVVCLDDRLLERSMLVVIFFAAHRQRDEWC